MDPVSLNFQNAGYDSTLVIPQLGLLFYAFVGMIVLAVIQVMLFLMAKAIPKTSYLNNKVKRYLYWNGSIRFFTESYMSFTLMALINVKHLDWESDFIATQICNYFAIFVIVLSCSLPIVMSVLYLRSMQNWENDDYKEKYGALLDGTKHFKKNQWVVILVPITYFARRLCLCLVLVFWIEFFWGQVAI